MAALLDQFLLPFIEVEAFGVVAGSNTVAGTAFAYANAGIAGGASGAIATGTVKGAAMGALEAEAFFGVGQALGAPAPNTSFFSGHTLAVFVAHGAVGGLFSIDQKGGFGSGFLAAGIGSLADAPQLDIGTVGNLVTHAVAGGLGSMLGGGKFLNGAATSSFGYLFNKLAHLISGNILHRAIERDIIAKQAAAGDPNWYAETGTDNRSYVIDLLRNADDPWEYFELKRDTCEGSCYEDAKEKLAAAAAIAGGVVGNPQQYGILGQISYEGYTVSYHADVVPHTGMIFYSIAEPESLFQRLFDSIGRGWRPGSYSNPRPLPGAGPSPAPVIP